MMFNHPLHNQVLTILRLLNADFLEACGVYFGGGTLLALSYGEYRLSRDIDFLCCYGADFSRLRTAIYDQGLDALFQPLWRNSFQVPRELRTDRDGIRFSIAIADLILKFEIVAEGRISLEPPIYPPWSPVPCLSEADQVAEKLLANGDRWADASTDSRDLIDLAMLKLNVGISETAIAKAESAYRSIDPLKRSILNFQAKPEYRRRCYERLGIQSPSQVMNGLDQLAIRFDLPLTERLSIED